MSHSQQIPNKLHAKKHSSSIGKRFSQQYIHIQVSVSSRHHKQEVHSSTIMAWHKFLTKSTHKKEQKECDCYGRLNDDADFYDAGESFIARCQKQNKKNMKALQTLFKGYCQTTFTRSKLALKDVKQPNKNNVVEKADSGSPFEGPNAENDRKLLMERRNAICEKSIEERYGLTLYVQCYSFNKYMENFEDM